MKILYINNGITHYFNGVLSKLNNIEGVELVLVAPRGISKKIGDSVYQSRDNVNFRICELPEYKYLGIVTSFRGLARLLLKEKPDIVVTADIYIYSFLLNIMVILSMKMIGSKLIMKSIPFRVPYYETARSEIRASDTNIIKKIFRLVRLRLSRMAYKLPDAHVNYIDEARDLYASYGVSSDKIFITRNSPDTEMYSKIKITLKNNVPVLPKCNYRLIHVGRLIEWKRVDMLLRAFSRIKKTFEEAELLIIGKGRQESALRKLSKTLGVSNDVRFLGGIYDPALLGSYLMESTIYVLAGMGGISINDAMCFGLPIICSVCDGTEKSLVKDGYNGKYFNDGDEDDLVDKITYLFKDIELCRQMGKRSVEIIRNEVNIHTVTNEYMRAFKYVLKKNEKKAAQ